MSVPFIATPTPNTPPYSTYYSTYYSITTMATTNPKRTVLVTGATSGIGLEAARHLAKEGHTVIVASRDQGRVEACCAGLREDTKSTAIHALTLNLASLASVKEAADQLLNNHSDWAFDTLVLNAGLHGMNFEKSAEGLEITFATNHLGHYYLARLLTPRLLENAKAHQVRARVIIVSSGTHDPANHTPVTPPIYNLENWRLPAAGEFNAPRAYTQSKLANALFGNDLAAQFDPQELTVAIFDPGFISETGLSRDLGGVGQAVVGVLGRLYLRTVHAIYGSTLQIGSMSRSPAFLARLAVDSSLVEETGHYYCIDAIDKCSVVASDRAKQVELREFSDAILKELGHSFS